MFRLLILCVITLIACDEENSTGVAESDFEFIGASFNYDISSSSTFQKKPFAQKNGDTLIIADYWAMGQQPSLEAEANINNDTIILEYSKVPLSPEKDWMPTVETISRFTGVLPNELTIRIEPAPNAREPSESEKEQGFRDAGEPLIETIQLDSL